MNGKQSLTLSLSLEELNKIMNALGKQPYEQVFHLINKIQTQAHEQLQALDNSHLEENKTLSNVKPEQAE